MTVRLHLTDEEYGRLMRIVMDWRRLDSSASLGVGDALDDSLMAKLRKPLRGNYEPPKDPAFNDHVTNRFPDELERLRRKTAYLAQQLRSR